MRGNCAVSTCTIAFLFICIVCICSKSGNAMLCQYAFLVKNTLQGGSLLPYRCKYTLFSWTNGVSYHFYLSLFKKVVKKVVMLPPSCQYYHNIRLHLPPSAMPQQQCHFLESRTSPADSINIYWFPFLFRKNYRTMRKPRRMLRRSGTSSHRTKTRQSLARLRQLPPRRTRNEPEEGPCGLIWDELL